MWVLSLHHVGTSSGQELVFSGRTRGLFMEGRGGGHRSTPPSGVLHAPPTSLRTRFQTQGTLKESTSQAHYLSLAYPCTSLCEGDHLYSYIIFMFPRLFC